MANAIKFNKEQNGTIFITIGIQRVLNFEGVTNRLKFLIKDSGIGMTKLQIKQSKEAFGNLNHNTNDPTRDSMERTSGIGLGISTSKTIAEGMNGSLMITSKKSGEIDLNNSGERSVETRNPVRVVSDISFE